MKQAALTLARAGLEVFPVGPDKAPLTRHGFKDATTDVRQIRAWDWPWGVGAAIPSGQIVLDVDPRNGGDETLAAYPALPPTRTTKTQSGGRHYWLAVKPELSLKGKLGDGVDVKRAGKGYVVVPPSPGYVYIRGGALAAAPAWLLEALVCEERPVVAEAGRRNYFPFEEGSDYGLRARSAVLEELTDVSNGERNNALNRAAFKLGQLNAGGELAAEPAILKLTLAGEALDLSAFEVRNTIESGWKAGQRVPRGRRG